MSVLLNSTVRDIPRTQGNGPWFCVKRDLIDAFLRADLNTEALIRASCLKGEKRRPLWSLKGASPESKQELDKHKVA